MLYICWKEIISSSKCKYFIYDINILKHKKKTVINYISKRNF